MVLSTFGGFDNNELSLVDDFKVIVVAARATRVSILEDADQDLLLIPSFPPPSRDFLECRSRTEEDAAVPDAADPLPVERERSVCSRFIMEDLRCALSAASSARRWSVQTRWPADLGAW